MDGQATERLAYRVFEAGEKLGISRAKTYQLVAAGVLPSVKIGGCVRVPAQALREWLARQLAERA